MLAPFALSLVLAPAPSTSPAPTVQRPTVQRPGGAQPAPVPEPGPPSVTAEPSSPVAPPQPNPTAPVAPELVAPPADGGTPVLPPATDPTAPLSLESTQAPTASPEPDAPAVSNWDATPPSDAPPAATGPVGGFEDSPFDEPDGPPVAPPSALEVEAELAEVSAAPQAKPASDDFRRRGVGVRAGGGLMHCPQQGCDPVRIGGNGHLDLGYRLGVVFPSAFVDGGGGPYASDFLDDAGDEYQGGSITFLGFGAQLLFFPVKLGRFDPYFGGGIGWQRVVSAADLEVDNFWGSSGVPEQVSFRRPAGRVSVGLDVFVTRRFAIGPRFDWWIPFSGRICTAFTGSEEEECEDIRREVGGGETEYSNRSLRRNAPKARSVTVDFTAWF